MLNCVIYAVTDEGYEYLTDIACRIKELLHTEGMELEVIREDKMLAALRGETDLLDLITGKSSLLVVSDSPELVRMLKDKGFYVTGFYHPKNKDKIFEGVSYAVTDVEEVTAHTYKEVYCRQAGLPWDILETERLCVRESMVEDVEDFYRIYGEPSITDYIEELFQDPEEERAYMEAYIRQMYGFYGFGMWTVIEKKTGRIIGRAGLDVREGYELPELGFVIEKASQRKGYGKEVGKAILNYAKEELFFDSVQALVEKENLASVRLLEYLGFTYERDVTERGREYQLLEKKL